MMARSFAPHMVAAWGNASVTKQRRPSTPTENEPSPEDEDTVADPATKKPMTTTTANDSDHETASASSSEPTSAGVASSFARAGKLLWSKNPLSGLAALTKQHSRTVADFSETDFTTPFAPGTPVWTRYGLGTVEATRADDGFLVVSLQCVAKMTLYLNPADEDYFSVPAIRHDWVETPAGEGLVMAFDAKQQSYRVRIGSSGTRRSDVEVNVHRTDLRRIMPVRRQTQHAHPQHQQKQEEKTPVVAPTFAPATATASEASVLAKGINSAFKTIATTSSGITSSLSTYFYHGQCVVTTFGQGNIVALDQTNHRAQVQLTWGAMAYLNNDAVLHYTKALVGMEVTAAKFGSGVVVDMRPADAMYTVKLDALNKDGEQETVYVHESDLVRGRRTRLGSAPKQFTEKIGASTTKLFSRVKLFGHGNTAPAEKTSPSPAINAVKTPMPPSRSKSVRVEETEDGVSVSSAGI